MLGTDINLEEAVMPHIDIVGINNPRTNKRKNRPQNSYLTLPEYLLIAKKIVSHYATTTNGYRGKMLLNNEDAMSSITYAIMLADWTYDGRGSIEGYRKYLANCEIRSIMRRYAKSKSKNVLSLDVEILNEARPTTWADVLEDYITDHPPASSIKTETYIEFLELAERIMSICKLTKTQRQYFTEYYIHGLTSVELSQKFGVSKQNVSAILKACRTKLKAHKKEIGEHLCYD